MDLAIGRTKSFYGSLYAVPSKSYTHRALIVSSLDDKTVIGNPLKCNATLAMKRACEAFGAKIEKHDDEARRWKVTGFGHSPKSAEKVDVENSGTAMRFSIALASLPRDGGKTVITGDASLKERPNAPLVKSLRDLGVTVKGIGSYHTAPVIVIGNGIKGGKTTISGGKSSQFISSLLLTCPRAEKETEINISDSIVSKPYIEMTINILKQAAIKISYYKDEKKIIIPPQQEFACLGKYEIHGDYSQAAFLFAVASLFESDIIVKDLVDAKREYQGDQKIIGILEDMGVDIKHTNSEVKVKGPSELEGIDIDLRDTPDLFPVLATLGVFAKGRTRLYNVPQLRFKESDRISVLRREFSKMGVKIETSHDEMIIYPRNPLPKKADFDPSGIKHRVPDHRIAMALVVLGLKIGKAKVRHIEAIENSYPNFVADLKKLGANILL